MNIYRKMDIALYYFLKELADNLGIVTLREGFLEVNFDTDELPILVFDIETVNLSGLELGSRKWKIERSYVLSVFAKTKKQRDDIVYEFFTKSESPVEVYNYDEGFPPDPITKIGALKPLSVSLVGRSYGTKEKKLYNAQIRVNYIFEYT